MKKLLPIIFCLLALFSCQPEGRIYVEHQELSPELEWLREDARTFTVPISDNSVAYNTSIAFRYASGYGQPILAFRITETSPSGISISRDFSIPVVNEKGEYQGEPGLDIWDLEMEIESGKVFSESGDHTFLIEHIMPEDNLNYAMEIGLILDKAK